MYLLVNTCKKFLYKLLSVVSIPDYHLAEEPSNMCG